MAEKGLISKGTLTAIADAIRAKTETSETMLPGEMAALIAAIETGAPLPDWITEIDFVKGSVSAIVQTMSVPTTLSAAPTCFLIAASSKSAISTNDVLVTATKSSVDSSMRMMGKSSTTVSSSPSWVNASFSDGTINFSIGGGQYSAYFVNGRTYSVVMWR